MGEKLQLPGGHWAILKDPAEITVKQARGLQRRYLEFGRQTRASKVQKSDDVVLTPDPTKPPEEDEDVLTDERFEANTDFEHDVIAYFIEEWDFDFKPTGANLDELPVTVFNKLDDATEPLVEELIPAIRKRKRGDSPTRP